MARIDVVHKEAMLNYMIEHPELDANRVRDTGYGSKAALVSYHWRI